MRKTLSPATILSLIEQSYPSPPAFLRALAERWGINPRQETL